MKRMVLFWLALPAAMGQTGSGSISGSVVDAETQKPVPAALVMAVSSGLPRVSKAAKSGGGGEFQIGGLPAGRYSLCVQAAGEQYLDPCRWDGSPVTVSVVAGQAATSGAIRLRTASLLTIKIQDAFNVLSQRTRDGRRPELTVGVWGPRGLYYPARAIGGPSTPPNTPGGVSSYRYSVAVPRDIPLKFHIGSRDLILGDAGEAPLPGNTSQETFQQVTGDTRPRSFSFSVLGLRP